MRGKLKGHRIPVRDQLTSKSQRATTSQNDTPAVESIPSNPSCSQLTLRASSPHFIDYYDKNLAGLMVWVDSEENDYRRRILPMAASVPGLRLAIAAFSSYHGTIGFPHEMSRFPEAARDACLSMIQRQLQDMTGRLTGGSELNSQSDIANAEWMLACILMIACFEMANSQSAAAEGHRQAARMLVNVFGPKEACNGGLFAFLRNQLSIYDILASTTSFDLSDVQRAILPTPKTENVLFADYLSVLHQVTLYSRQAMVAAENPDLQPQGEAFSTNYIRSRFEQARGQTLMAAGKLRLDQPVIRRDFIRLVDIYHNAAVLFSYRSLGLSTMDNVDRLSATSKLFEQLGDLEDLALSVQNLPWPAFIAGTECYGDRARQDYVVELLTKILGLTGFKHYADIVTFLREFWNGPDPDWQPLARQYQANGVRILLV